MTSRLISTILVVALTAAGISPLEAKQRSERIKYAKSEVDKAIVKCIGTVIGGAFLGSLIAGKKKRAEGAVAGAALGGGICAVIVKDAKKKDRMFEAQLRAAAANSGKYTSTFTTNEGQSALITANAGEAKMIPASLLVPVRYKFADSTTLEAPVLPGPEALCRTSVASVKVGADSFADAPAQLSCRTENGDWAAYSLKST